jgi:hypothetical protein
VRIDDVKGTSLRCDVGGELMQVIVVLFVERNGNSYASDVRSGIDERQISGSRVDKLSSWASPDSKKTPKRFKDLAQNNLFDWHALIRGYLLGKRLS